MEQLTKQLRRSLSNAAFLKSLPRWRSRGQRYKGKACIEKDGEFAFRYRKHGNIPLCGTNWTEAAQTTAGEGDDPASPPACSSRMAYFNHPLAVTWSRAALVVREDLCSR